MGLNDIQKVCLETYKEYKKICDKYNLNYFAIGGTCIGAVRHNGFIPWDDDIDIAMPIKDLFEFIEISKDELDKSYSIYSPKKIRNFKSNFYKLYNVKTTYIEKENIKYPESYRGIGIDLMPIYGMPKGDSKQLKMAKTNDMFLTFNEKNRSSFLDQINISGKLNWILLYPFYKKRNWNYWIDKSIDKYAKIPFDNSDKIIFGWRRFPYKRRKTNYKSVFSYEDFSSWCEMRFEDTNIRVPIGWDNYLKSDFGDYLTLPPVEQRKTMHNVVIIDTKKSYKDYIGKI